MAWTPSAEVAAGRGSDKQTLLNKRRAPSFSFGGSTREQNNLLFVSQEHTQLATAGMHSPGPAQYSLPASVGGKQPDGRKGDPPVWRFSQADRWLYGYGKPDMRPGPASYKMPASVGGKQPDGRKRDPPVISFGTATRQQVNKLFVSNAHTLIATGGVDSPGPAQYSLPASVGGKQPDGRKADPPSYSISSAARAPVEAGGHSPGPIYRVPPTVGPQPNGRYSNAPRAQFGASTRAIREKIFISREHEATSMPTTPTPGPAAPYQLDQAIGKQRNSRYATGPRVTFSRASRWAHHEREMARNSVPGPGAYS